MPLKKSRVKVSDLKGIKLYNFLLKQLGEQNVKSSRKQLLGIRSRRKIVSEKLYPEFSQGTKPTLKAIKKSIAGVIKSLPPKEICNPIYLSPAYLAQIEYYDIDNHIRNVLPDCINVRVNAGILGKTKIFNTKGYSYYSDGVRNIVEKIRDDLKNNNSGQAYFDGVVKLKYNKPNNGKAENYFIDYILFIDNLPVTSDIPVEYNLTKSDEVKKKDVKGFLTNRFLKLQKEKVKKRRISIKSKPKTKKEITKQVSKEIRTAISALRRLLKAGAISKEQFEKQKQNLMSLKNKP